MRILIVSGNDSDRLQIREHFDQLPFNEHDLTLKPEIIEAITCEDALEMIISDTQKLIFYELIIVANTMSNMGGLQFAKKLIEEKIAPKIPVAVYYDRLAKSPVKNGKEPGVTVSFEIPITFNKFGELMSKIGAILISEEDDNRKKEIQSLMRQREKKDFPLLLEDIYMNSARNITNLKEYCPWSHLPYLSLGRIYVGCNMYEAAIPHLKKVVDTNPSLKEAHSNLAMCYRKTGRSFEEHEELMDMLEAEPTSSTVLLKVGDSCLRKREYKNAIEYFKEAIANHKTSDSDTLKAKSHVGLGKGYIQEGDATNDDTRFVMAKDEFNIAMKIDPTLVAVYNNLIVVYKKLGMYEELRSTMAKAVKIMPNNAEGWIDLFEIYLIDGETRKAKYSLEKALKYDPESQLIPVTAGEIYMRQKMFEEAIDIFEKTLDINSSDKRLYSYMGICYRRLEKFDLSGECYRWALKIDPDDPSLHYSIGKAYFNGGKMMLAKKAFRRAIELKPNYEEAKKALERTEDSSGSYVNNRRKKIR